MRLIISQLYTVYHRSVLRNSDFGNILKKLICSKKVEPRSNPWRIVTAVTVVTTVSVNRNLRRKSLFVLPEDRPSPKRLIKTTKFLKSPLFIVQLVLYAIGNCSVSVTLNVVNDLVSRDTDGALWYLFEVAIG